MDSRDRLLGGADRGGGGMQDGGDMGESGLSPRG